MSKQKNIYITEIDLERLNTIIENMPSNVTEKLEGELARATIVKSEEIPASIVSMNSVVRFKNLESNQESEVQLVYPENANSDENKISIVAPIGTALLGLSEGDSINWPTPSGNTTLEIVKVVFQPEAAGRFDL